MMLSREELVEALIAATSAGDAGHYSAAGATVLTDKMLARKMTGTVNTVLRFLSELPDYLTVMDVVEELNSYREFASND